MRKIILTCTLAASVFSYSHSAHAASSYTVKSGDSLWSLSQKYHVSIKDIKNANHLQTNLIKIGEQLSIPTRTNTQLSSSGYTVKSGDSLWSIAQKYHTTVDTIKQANQLKTTIIQPGQHLKIPTSSTTSKTNKTVAGNQLQQGSDQYIVKGGDTLSGIAMAKGTPVSLIKSANHLTSSLIKVGERLTIPQLLTQNEKTLLAHLVTAEAKGEPFRGQIAVATVVLNRVDSSQFPNTLKGVIYQTYSSGSYAFTPVQTGSINQPVVSSAVKAVNQALAKRDIYKKSGALFFYNPKLISNNWILSRPVTATIGHHVFAK